MYNPFEGAVFVIGAGASAPYGFPTGEQLRKNILDLEYQHKDLNSSATNTAHAVFLEEIKKENFTGEDFKKFCNEFASTGAPSIDDFLQAYAVKNHKYYRLGQLVIYYLISIAENNWHYRGANDWIEIFVRYMMYENNREKFLSNPPQFISFNYDNFLKSKIEFNVKTQYLIEDYKFENVINIYGKTSGLNFEKQMEEIYKVSNFDEISKESLNISLIRSDNIDTSEHVQKIRSVISKAERLIILGYAFNRTNNKILFENEDHFNKLLRKGNVVATGFGLDPRLAKKINSIDTEHRSNPVKTDYDCKALIDSLIPRELF